MAIVQNFLADNARDFNSPNWLVAAGTVGAGFNGDGVLGPQLTVARGSQLVNNNMDQSAAGPNPEYFDVLDRWTGDLGDVSNPLKFGCDGTAESAVNQISRFRHWGKGNCIYNADTGCHFLEIGGSVNFNLIGGDVKHVRMDGGYLNMAQAATAGAAGTWDFMRGCVGSRIDTHATDLLVTVNVRAGKHEWLRGAATINVYGGETTVDLSNTSITTLNIEEGLFRIRSHNATGPALTAKGGVLDFSELTRPITFTNAILGRVLFVGYKKSLVTFTTPTYTGQGPIGMN